MKKILIGVLCLCMIFVGNRMKIDAAETIADDEFELTILNTGKSDCIIIEAADMVILNDAAEEDDYKLIKKTLDEKNIKDIDYMILSHFDKDHIGCASEIIENYNVECIIMPNYVESSKLYTNLVNCIEEKDIPTIKSDYEIESGELNIKVSAPQKEFYDDVNNYSMITSVTYGDTSFLLLGDALQERMEEYLKNDTSQYLFVKMPHHGDYFKLLKQFVESNGSCTAVITDDLEENRTQEKLLQCLENNNCETLFSYNGNIILTSDGKAIEVIQ